MAGQLPATEINATFYRTQTPQTFRAWHDAVPDGFTFAVKVARGAAQRRDAAEAAPAVERFLNSGLAELGPKLGPLLWQLPAGRKFDAEAFARFLDLLPDRLDGLPLRHAIEAAHPSFDAAEPLLTERGIARVILDKAGAAPADRPTAAHVYLRLQGTRPEIATGYDDAALDGWAARLRAYAGPRGRRVFAFVIAGAKERNPPAALALLARSAPSAVVLVILTLCASQANAAPPPRPAAGTLAAPMRDDAVPGGEENLVVHGVRRLQPAPQAARHFAAFEDRADVYHGWRPGNGRDPNTDAYIGEFGTAYGESAPAPGANLSAPGTISPIQSGLRR